MIHGVLSTGAVCHGWTIFPSGVRVAPLGVVVPTGAGATGAGVGVGVGAGAIGVVETGCTGLFLVTKALKASFHCEFFMSRACCASVSSNQDFFLIMSRAIAIVLS